MPRADGYNRAVVLILTQCFPPAIGGIENYLGGMAYALAAARHEVTVYADASPTATDGDAPFRTRRFGGIKMLRRRRKARAAEKLMRQGNVSHLICDTWKSMEHVNPSDGAARDCPRPRQRIPRPPVGEQKAADFRIAAKSAPDIDLIGGGS